MKFDYIGAPWDLVRNSQNIALHESHQVLNGVGNGGFSFRNVRIMERIADQFGAYSPHDENEDIFFAVILNKMNVLLPTRAEAYSFCLEVSLLEFKNSTQIPFALHAAWYYNEPSVITPLLQMTLL